ncbi:Hypothetical protein PHPALM_19897 [Phytophthora palmivora]|uniref:BTB domain-containing protein n=1 Tax=Phytophthora palmivora TaxID=4796 RepID=A0A2P4XG87_9STRA|nr:Hypothetical protein PHPALM_19897 [Phytophthora palmivora]
MKSAKLQVPSTEITLANSSRNVVIHVFDECRKTSKEFTCQRDLLLAKMKYFQAYLNEANEHDEIDISVHCDVEIFELLMEYMHQHSYEWRPRMTLENIASILVSSEFLQMEELVEECVTFISGRVQDFMMLRVDFGCLSDATITKIASNCTPEQLQTLHDPKDKILSKLRRKKVEALVKSLQEGGRRLEMCTNCQLLFIRGERGSIGCQKGTKLWGEYMAGTAMVSSFFKGEERVKLMVKTPNIQELYVESMAVGEVRGKAVYVDQSLAGAPESGGHMHVSKILYGAAKPYNTSIEASGVPELDWQRFFDVSEQVPTIVRIDSAADEDHTRSCGFIVQKMPLAETHERQYELEELPFDKLPFLASELKKNSDLLEYLNELIPGADITDKNCKRVPLDYYCRCSKDSYAQRLKDMGSADLKQIAADVGSAGVDLTCHFCNDAYHFSANELTGLIESLRKPQN